MIDAHSHDWLQVYTDGSAGPYIMLPVVQMEQVRRVLDQNLVAYWADICAVSVDGKPAISVLNLRRGTDVGKVQSLLDALP